jgi:hypothetical protein
VLEQLLPLVRFPLLETRFLLEDVGKNPILEILPITHELLHEAFRSHHRHHAFLIIIYLFIY